jgi:phage portal protein BeeE
VLIVQENGNFWSQTYQYNKTCNTQDACRTRPAIHKMHAKQGIQNQEINIKLKGFPFYN